MNTSELGKQLKDTGAYENPEGKKAIDEALPKMHAAETAGDKGEVNRLREELTKELERVFSALSADLPPETSELLRGFEAQFRERLDELDAFGIVDKANPKIKGIDNKEYPAPSWGKIKAGFTPERMALIAQLENPTLLLVPDGMSLNEYLIKAGGDKAPPKRKLPWNKASDIDLGADKDGSLISDAGTYDKATHGGKTKMQRLQEPGALGWQVYVVDGGDEVPETTLGKKADDLLAEFRSQGFGGLSAEANFSLQMHGQVRGKQFDINNWGWLLESYLTSIGVRGVVLDSGWDVSVVGLFRYVPERSFEDLGARRSVRVL